MINKQNIVWSCYTVGSAFCLQKCLRSNSSNTSRRTSPDFQTPKAVENTRRSRVIFNEIWGVLKSEEFLLTSVWMYFLNEPVFCEKINEKNGLIYVISSSDFKTSSMVFIFFALAFLIIVINLRTIDKGVTSGGEGVFTNFVYFCTTRGKKNNVWREGCWNSCA